jgi:hypothetical protein
MNNTYVMSASFESKKNSQAMMITIGFAGLMLALMFLVSWTIPKIIHETPPQEMLVELNLPEEPEPPVKSVGGGGGGGAVQAPEKAGVAPPSPPDPGTKEDARDIEDDPKENTPPILRPDAPKPDAKKINENKAPVVPPKTDPKPPAPRTPSHVMTRGQTNTGTSTGGNEATTYERSGGRGPSRGVGDGPGGGGGTGGGTGGGRGTGVGPEVTRGDRSIVGSYTFEGDLEKATIYVDVKVSPDGVGQFMNFARGSSTQNSAYRTAIISYLRKMRFNKSNSESNVTVRFNFKVNG